MDILWIILNEEYSDVIGVVKEAHELGEITSKSTQKTACHITAI